MELTIFKNKIFYYLLISYLTILICWNSYILTKGVLKGIIPIVIQLIIIYLIIDKHKFAKIGIKIWSIVIILSHGISLLAKFVKIALGDDTEIPELLNKTVFLTIGVLIYIFNEKYTELLKIDK